MQGWCSTLHLTGDSFFLCTTPQETGKVAYTRASCSQLYCLQCTAPMKAQEISIKKIENLKRNVTHATLTWLTGDRWDGTSIENTRGKWHWSGGMCHGMTPLLLSFPLSPLRPPPLGSPPSTLRLHPTSSASTPPPFRFNSDTYVRNWQDYVAQALGITADQCRTHPDLVPTPRAAVCIPLLHSSYLSDPFSLPIMGNCFLL